MKRILIFAPTAPTSGITQYILNILGAFDTESVKFDILSFKNYRLKAWCKEHGTDYYEFNLSPYKQRKEYMAFLKNVFARDYDVIYYHLSTISELAIFRLAKKKGRKIIVHSHAISIESQSKLRYYVFTYLHKFLRIFANRYSDCKCTCSLAGAQWMYGKKAAEEAIIMNNAIQAEKFTYCEDDRYALRQKLGINTKYVLGHVGRFAVPKNHSFLLEIFAEVLKNNNDCTLVLIGNGELENQIKQKAKNMGLNENVVFVDFQEDIYRYYSLFDLFVMPSLFEGLPITLVEAQANGLSSLVSDAITRESDLTGLVEFYSLENGSDKWAERINEKLEFVSRIDTAKMIEERGFSLKSQAETLNSLFFTD